LIHPDKLAAMFDSGDSPLLRVGTRLSALHSHIAAGRSKNGFGRKRHIILIAGKTGFG
jgi:hypothetical protein